MFPPRRAFARCTGIRSSTALRPRSRTRASPSELNVLFRESQDELAATDRLAERLARFMTEAALQEFPDLKQASPENLRKIGHEVFRHSTDFAIAITNLAQAEE